MHTLVDRLFITPMSWLLAVPIVLIDRLMSSDLDESPNWDTRSCCSEIPAYGD